MAFGSASADQGRRLLACDVGGTKTDVAIVSTAGGPRELLAHSRYPTTEYRSLSDLATAFLAEAGMGVHAACVDVAGPVVGGRARLTNVEWEIDEAALASTLRLQHVWVLNDLVAMASAIPLLRPDELHAVKAGEQGPGPIAVLAPGTGLGEAYLVPHEGGYRAYGSEGGHASFAPTNELELELLRWLWNEFEHVSFERVASGVGIPNIYRFLRDRPGGISESRLVAARIAETREETRPIVEASLFPLPADPLAAATVELFLRILGNEAGNLALKVLATGGVYLAGGIAQALRDKLAEAPFLEAFVSKGRFRPLLERVPVSVVMGEVALLGAASVGLRALGGAT
jgi:glucokinase